MKNVIVGIFALATFLIAPVSKAQVKTDLNSRLYSSVGLLYSQDGQGDMKMLCTATAFDKKADPTLGKEIYRFVSAAHCVSGNDDKKQKLQKFYISSDSNGEKTYFVADLIEAGDKKMGDDFSIFEISTASDFSITPLGDDSILKVGDQVVNVAGALGFGKQFFSGYVSETHLDRPPIDATDVIWTDIMLVQVGGAPGSSGSAIVSVDQKAIVGFLVGEAGADNGKICVPVSKFKTFLALVDSGKYKKTPVVTVSTDDN